MFVVVGKVKEEVVINLCIRVQIGRFHVVKEGVTVAKV